MELRFSGKVILAASFLASASFLRSAAADEVASIPAMISASFWDFNRDGFSAADPKDEVWRGSPSVDTYERGALEFDLSSLPRSAIITSAGFVDSISVSGGTTHLIGFGLYAGNGTMEMSDAVASTTLVASLNVGYWLDNPNRSISLPVADVQSIFNTSRYLGLNMWQISGDGGIGFTSYDSPNHVLMPALNFTYTIAPEASSLVLLGAGGAALLRRRRRGVSA